MNSGCFKFKVFEDLNGLTSLQESWESLCDKIGDEITIFSTFDWYQNWWKSYGADSRLHLFTMWEGEDLVGIAPLMWKKYYFHKLPARTIGFIQNNQSLHNDIVVIPNKRGIFIENIIKSLFELSSMWDVVFLRNLSVSSSNYNTLKKTLDSNGAKWLEKSNKIDSPYLVPLGTWKDYFASRSTRTRKNIKNIHNKINSAGNVSVKNIRTREEFMSCKDEIFCLAQQSWTETIGDSLGSPANRHFFESLALNAADKGRLSIWVLCLDKRMVAVEFHLRAYGKEHAMRGHYHPDFASLSPGAYLEMKILQHVFEEEDGVGVYDFCGSFDGYKKKWTDTCVPHCDILIFKEKMYSRCIMFNEGKFVPFLRKALQSLKLVQ